MRLRAALRAIPKKLRVALWACCAMGCAASSGPPSVTGPAAPASAAVPAAPTCVRASVGRDLRSFPRGTPWSTIELTLRGDADDLRASAAPHELSVALVPGASSLVFELRGADAVARCAALTEGYVQQGGRVVERCGACE